MEPNEYEAMYQLEDDLWWYKGMRRITRALLQEHLSSKGSLKILDAGAGSGGSLALLKPFGEVTAFDFSPLAVDFYRTRESGRVAQASAAAMPYQDASFDLVTVFDVLTTLDDATESQAVAEVARVLKPGGYFYWREPAFMFLYGPHDRAVHSQRRYTKGEFNLRLRRNGLQPVRVSYANSLLFPVAAAGRLVAKVTSKQDEPPRSDVREVPGRVNSVLEQVLSLEAPFIVRFGLPVGLSIVTLARKQ
jgi:SAM-dependent methyltransferase